MAAPICLCIVYSCFCVTMAGLSSCHRDYMAHIAKRIYYLALDEASLPTPAVDERRQWLRLVPQRCRKVEWFKIYLRFADGLI